MVVEQEVTVTKVQIKEWEQDGDGEFEQGHLNPAINKWVRALADCDSYEK